MFRRINQKLEAARINAQEKSDAEDSEDSEDSEHELPASFNPSAVTFGDLSSEDEQEEEQDTARTKDVATNHQNQHSATAPPPSVCPVTHTIFPVPSTDQLHDTHRLQSRLLSTVVLPGSFPGD